MEQLLKLKDSVMDYLSPAKRRHTLQVSTPPRNRNLMQRPAQSMSEPRNRKGKAVIAGRVSKNYLSPSNVKQRLQKSISGNESDDDYVENLKYEQSSVSQLSQTAITPGDSSSQIKYEDSVTSISLEEKETNLDDQDLVSGDESELDAKAKVDQYLDRQTQLARHREALEITKHGEWHKDEVAIYMKLAMRGFEPLIPAHWSYDFRTCPQSVFSHNLEETMINAKSGNEFRGTNALSSLVTMGARVRALAENHKPQEELIKTEIEKYVKWSERDGGYASKRFIPLLCVVAGDLSQDIDSLSKSISDQMGFLALKHRQACSNEAPGQINEDGEVEMFFRQPPIVYGIIIARSKIVFLTMNSANPEAKPRTIAHFDFTNKEMDVWNGFAIAMLVCTVRDLLVDSPWEMESDGEDSDDDLDL